MEHGFGTTHFALTLANYICSKMGMRVAYVELNGSGHISSLKKHRDVKNFSFQGITFFPNVTITSLAEILCSDYPYFILDMGIISTYTVQEFLRCDKPFLICSPCAWRYHQTKDKIEKTFKNISYKNQLTVILNLCEKESNFPIFLKQCRHVLFPYLPNPFQIEPKHFSAISQILERN